MANSILDAILPSAGRTPAGDSSSHAGDASTPFGPVLNQALAADDSTTNASRFAEPTTPRPSPGAAPAAEDRRESSSGDEHTDVESGVEVAQEHHQADADSDDDHDDVAISDDATAAAEAAAAATGGAAQTGLAAADAAVTEIEAKAAATAAKGNGKGQPSAPDLPGDQPADGAGATPGAGLKEIGDVLATEPQLVPGSTSRTQTTKAKPTKGDKTAASTSDSHKVAGNDATTAAGQRQAKANAKSADEDKVSDESASKSDDNSKAKDNSKPVADGDLTDSAQTNDKRPAAHRSDPSTPNSTDATAIQQNDGASAEAEPTAPANEATSAPVVAAASATAEPVPQTHRSEATLARLTADRSIHANAAHGSDETHGVDRARFVGRVEGAIRSAHQRDGRVQVRLSPPELGALRIELSLHQGALTARVEAETTTARNLLLDNLPALRDRLAQHDVRVERFDVDVRQEGGSGGSPQQGADDRTAREADGRRQAPRRDARPQLATKPAARSSRAGGVTDTGLDVRV